MKTKFFCCVLATLLILVLSGIPCAMATPMDLPQITDSVTAASCNYAGYGTAPHSTRGNETVTTSDMPATGQLTIAADNTSADLAVSPAVFNLAFYTSENTWMDTMLANRSDQILSDLYSSRPVEDELSKKFKGVAVY